MVVVRVRKEFYGGKKKLGGAELGRVEQMAQNGLPSWPRERDVAGSC